LYYEILNDKTTIKKMFILKKDYDIICRIYYIYKKIKPFWESTI